MASDYQKKRKAYADNKKVREIKEIQKRKKTFKEQKQRKLALRVMLRLSEDAKHNKPARMKQVVAHLNNEASRKQFSTDGVKLYKNTPKFSYEFGVLQYQLTKSRKNVVDFYLIEQTKK